MRSRNFATMKPILLLALTAVGGASCAGAISQGEPEDDPVTFAVAGYGLKGEYYNNEDLTALVLTRIDPRVSFDWGSGAPAPGVDADTFSVRWTGSVIPRSTGRYTFYTQCDDGVRLWIDGVKIVDNWTNHRGTEDSGSISLTAEQAVAITMEYYEHTGKAVAKLRWSSRDQPKEIIPSSRLRPPSDAGPAPDGGVGVDSGGGSGGRVGADASVPDSGQTGPAITLAWDDGSTNEDGFRVERKLQGGSTFALVATVGANVTAYEDREVSAGTTYCYRVCAWNGSGTSGYSNEICSAPR